MPDVSIVNSTITAAPKDYAVPGTQELLLKAVRASIDGTAAGSAFLPALQLIDPGGHVMWTAVDRSNPVAGGGTADVSWFPGVKAAAASTTTSTNGRLDAAQLLGTSQNIPTGSVTAIQWDEQADDGSGVINNGGSPSSTWTFAKEGLYIMSLQLLPSPSWPAAGTDTIVMVANVAGQMDTWGGWSSWTPGSTAIGYFGQLVSTYGNSPVAYSCRINNQSGTSFHTTGGVVGTNQTGLTVARISDTTSIS